MRLSNDICFQAILLGMALQLKSVEEVATDLEIEAQQLLGLFNRITRKFVSHFNEILEQDVVDGAAILGEGVAASRVPEMNPTAVSLGEELEEAAKVCFSTWLK